VLHSPTVGDESEGKSAWKFSGSFFGGFTGNDLKVHPAAAIAFATAASLGRPPPPPATMATTTIAIAATAAAPQPHGGIPDAQPPERASARRCGA
jgi:hypothetical protein